MEHCLTAERLRQLLLYDRETGIFIWRVGRQRIKGPGAIAGSITNRGYMRIKVEGKHYFSHRLAWMYVYGSWPALALDHKNQCKTDNRIDNLREVTHSQNRQNTGIYSNNSSGFRGVHRYKKLGKWQAQIVLNHKSHNLGIFDTAEDASAAYEAAASILHTHRPDAASAQ